MTYDELLDKWLRKLGRPCTAGEVVYDLRRLEQPVRCKDCKWYEISQLKRDGTGDKRFKPSVCVRDTYAMRRRADWFCADGERREDDAERKGDAR